MNGSRETRGRAPTYPCIPQDTAKSREGPCWCPTSAPQVTSPRKGAAWRGCREPVLGTLASHVVSEAPGPHRTAWDSTNPKPHTALPTRSVSIKCQVRFLQTLETCELCGAHRPLHQPLNLCACMLSPLSHFLLFATPWAVTHQAPLSMGFSRQEYCSGLLCPPPGRLPNPGIEPLSLISPALAGRLFTTRDN